MKLISRQEAKAKGLSRYFTGRTCSRGHTAEQSVSTQKCIDCRRSDVLAWRKANPERNKEKGRKYYIDRRRRIMFKIGHKCKCCGENRFEFLTLDHKNGGGSAHRRSFGKSKGTPTAFYKWADQTPARELKKILQVLCWSCNCAIGAWGYCPHRTGSKFECVGI